MGERSGSGHLSRLCHLSTDSKAFAKMIREKNKARVATLFREFNDDVEMAEESLGSKVGINTNYLIEASERDSLDPATQNALDRYGVLDTLAIHFRNRTHRIFVALLITIFSAMVVLESFAHIFGESNPAFARKIVWLYPAVWLVAWVIWYFAHRHHLQRKYHDYRALAEGLRVQVMWELSGVDDKVETHYLYKQQGELDWICCAIAAWRETDDENLDAAPRRTRKCNPLAKSLSEGGGSEVRLIGSAKPRTGRKN